MDRRLFLKLTGMVAAAGAFDALPVAPAAAAMLEPAAAAAPVRDLVAVPRLTVTRLAMREAGDYRVSGMVRLEAPTVEISGIANSQQITWAQGSGQPAMVVSFTSFEHYDGRGLAPEIIVSGGRLESLSVEPVDYL